jgi:hypothetical protein
MRLVKSGFTWCILLVTAAGMAVPFSAFADGMRPGEIRPLLSAGGSPVKSDSSYSFRFNEMARPAGLEPAAPWFEDIQYKTLSAGAGVAYRGTRHLSRS